MLSARHQSKKVDGDAPSVGRARRYGRWALRVGIAYVALVVLVNVLLQVVLVWSRSVADDPRTEFSGVPNFRVVDGEVWAGGQPYDEHTYRKLADAGVRLIVDLRTGARDDRNEADPALLASLGIDYVRLPVRDGHVPSDEQVDRFVEAVQHAKGTVLLHCGAGAGRSSAFTAAYARHVGVDPPVAAQLSIGSHSFEQWWFVTTGDTNPIVRRVSEAADAPRRFWSRLGETI